MAAIERELGKKLPLAALFHAPSVAQLARFLLEKESAPDWRSLAPIHFGGEQAPLFLIHWLERDLARHLGAKRPVWGLSLGLARRFERDGPSMPETVEDTAAHYVEELRSVRPDGPYFLIGHSAGGVVAFEMARRFVAAGQSVPFLGLLDADFPRPLKSRRVHPLGRQILNLLRTPPKHTYKNLRSLIGSSPRLLWRDHEEEGGSSISAGYRLRFTSQILDKYKPQTYGGKVHFFKSTAPMYSIRAILPSPPESEWARVASGGLEVHELPGDHMEIVKDPLAAQTAATIEACLAGV